MLVLTRKLGEGIAIGDDIKVIVMQVKGKQVRLGIKADPQTPVHREEVYQKILAENALASHAQLADLKDVAFNEISAQSSHPLKIRRRGGNY